MVLRRVTRKNRCSCVVYDPSEKAERGEEEAGGGARICASPPHATSLANYMCVMIMCVCVCVCGTVRPSVISSNFSVSISLSLSFVAFHSFMIHIIYLCYTHMQRRQVGRGMGNYFPLHLAIFDCVMMRGNQPTYVRFFWQQQVAIIRQRRTIVSTPTTAITTATHGAIDDDESPPSVDSEG